MSRADPPSSPKFQPSPSAHRAGNSSHSVIPAVEASNVAATRIAAPTCTADSDPRRSTYRPTSGLKANIPPMCAEMTYGLIASWPCSFMCTGVIVITATIAACDTAIEPSASRARGAAPITRTA